MSVKGAIIIEGHIQGLSNVRSLGELGIPVIVVDKNVCVAKFSKYCTKFYKCPSFESTDFVEFLIQLGEKEKLKDWILLPSNDFAVLNINKNQNKLRPYYQYFSNSLELMELIYNKEKLARYAIEKGIFVPRIIEDCNIDRIKFPIITKGVSGLNFFKKIGLKAIVSHDIGEYSMLKVKLEQKIEKNAYFSQEIIHSTKIPNTVSYAVFAENGMVINAWMGEKIRQHPWKFGTATFAKSKWHEECAIIGNKLMKSLNYNGVCEIEFQFDEISKTFALIEINARTWLWVELAKQSGVDFAKIIYKHLTKESIILKENQYVENVYWKNVYTDSFMIVKAVYGGQLNLKELVNYKRGKKVYAILQYKDLLPSFAFIFLIPKMIFSR